MKYIFLLFCMLGMIGCQNSRTPTPKELAGEYVYLYESGEIEVWILKENLSYRQEFYHTTKEYHNNDVPRFTNFGEFSIRRNLITFKKPYMFYNLKNKDNPLEKAVPYLDITGNWIPQTKTRVAAIWIYQDIGYGLFRMSRRSDVIDDR